MTAPHGIFIALGANLGDRAATLNAALADLRAHPAIEVRAVSAFHATAPVGGPPDQPPYLNAAAELVTDLSPHDLLVVLQGIEQAHGRVRTVRNGPRTLDLDLLLYHACVVHDPDLHVPHPRMWARDFVLVPLREICPAPQLAAFRALTFENSETSRDVH